ncbi:MAG: choice-of-anchor D domain-containing protein [Phormidesmis sp.]
MVRAMSETAQDNRLGDVSIDMGGDMSGSLVVGHGNQLHTYTYNVDHGGVLNVAAPPTVRPRETPINLRPRPFPNLLDRHTVLLRVQDALVKSLPVEVHAEPGFGKTALMRHVAYRPEIATRFADGVVYLSAVRQLAADLLQSLYDAFYEASPTFRPSYGQLQQALKDKRALIILNRLGLDKDEMEWLMAALPQCTFVLVSEARVYWQEGAAIALPGLPVEDAIALIEQDLGRSLNEAERAAAQTLCSSLSGNPLQIRRATAQAIAQNQTIDAYLSFVQVAQREAAATHSGITPSALKKSSLDRSVFTTAIAQLSANHKRLLALLGAVGGVALSADEARAISQLPDTTQTLNELANLQLVDATETGYQLCADLGEAVAQSFNLRPWLQSATEYFASTAGDGFAASGTANTDAMLHLLDWTQKTGQWQQSLSLAQGLDAALSVGGQWQPWEQVLTHGLQAAQQVGDGSAEAWYLHQLGTRAIASGSPTQATTWLSRAIALREQLGDRNGAKVSRHNLSLIASPVVTDREAARKTARRLLKQGMSQGASKLAGLAVAAVVGALLISGMGIALWVGNQSPPDEVDVSDDVEVSEPNAEYADSNTAPGEETDSTTNANLEIVEPIPGDNSTTLSFDVQSLAFGGVTVGQRSQKSLTITNSGGQPLVVQSVTVEGEEDFELIEQTCTGGDISPDQSCSATVSFEPGRMGDRVSQLTIDSNAYNDTTISINGTGINRRTGETPLPMPTPSPTPAPTPDPAPPAPRPDPAPTPDPEPTPQPENINQPPAVQDVTLSLIQGDAHTFDLLAAAQAYDLDPNDTVELSEVSNIDEVGGRLENNGDGTVTYYPYEVEEGQYGNYTNRFGFTVDESRGSAAYGTITITVTVPIPDDIPIDRPPL